MDEITLYKEENKKPFQFQYTLCSSATANDGYLPNGTSLSSVESTKFYDKNGTDVTTQILVGTPSLSTLTVSVDMQYPATAGDGRYWMKQRVRDSGSRDYVYYFYNIFAKSRGGI
jgi:hypothetical protein